MRSEIREETGDDHCPKHLWCYYITSCGAEQYRECRRCWLKEAQQKGNWTPINSWKQLHNS